MSDGERRALVTGAGSGIGLATAIRLHRDGWEVALADVNADSVEAAATGLGSRAFALALDVAQPDAVTEAAARLASRWAGLEGLVLAAGIEVNSELASQRASEWDRVIATNLSGQFHCVAACLELLTAARGAVVCVGSVIGRATYTGAAAYAASKAGLEGLVRAAALDCAPAVRVNCVLPGTTDTPMLRQGLTGQPLAELLSEAGDAIPLERVAEAAEIAAVIAFLLSEEAAYVTGSALVVDGGLLARLATNV